LEPLTERLALYTRACDADLGRVDASGVDGPCQCAVRVNNQVADYESSDESDSTQMDLPLLDELKAAHNRRWISHHGVKVGAPPIGARRRCAYLTQTSQFTPHEGGIMPESQDANSDANSVQVFHLVRAMRARAWLCGENTSGQFMSIAEVDSQSPGVLAIDLRHRC